MGSLFIVGRMLWQPVRAFDSFFKTCATGSASATIPVSYRSKKALAEPVAHFSIRLLTPDESTGLAAFFHAFEEDFHDAAVKFVAQHHVFHTGVDIGIIVDLDDVELAL